MKQAVRIINGDNLHCLCNIGMQFYQNSRFKQTKQSISDKTRIKLTTMKYSKFTNEIT